MGDYEETMASWCLRKEQIENSPSRHDGISTDLEAQTRSQYCQFIRWMCSQFKLDTIPTATAMMFCHRFYALQSLAKNDWKTIATACVFLSAKSEDSFRPLDDIVRIAFASDAQKLPTDSQRKDFLHKKRELIEMAEKMVLINLRFDTNVKHPYRPLHDAMKLLGINSKEIRREVWKLVGCWLESTLCLEYRPEWIAAASLHILGKLHGMKLPDVRNLPIWSEKFSPKKWHDCTNQMAQILCTQNWPQCTKLQPEFKPKHAAFSIQKLPEGPHEPRENKPKVVTPDSVLVMAEKASKITLDTVPNSEPIALDTSSHSEEAKHESSSCIGLNRAPIALDTSSYSAETAEAKQESSIGLNKAPIALDTSSYSEEAKHESSSCIGLNKAYIARIREAVRKRKCTSESCPVDKKARLDASSDDWIERELESGIIVEPKLGFGTERDEEKTEVDDSWIEKELEEGIILDSEPVRRKKSGGLKAWRERQKGRETEINYYSSKRQRR